MNVGIKEKFDELARRWHNETDHLSSPPRITSNAAYLKIIALGDPVVPLILAELERNGGHWFEALRVITGADPVSIENRGYIKKMIKDWVTWGKKQGYRW